MSGLLLVRSTCHIQIYVYCNVVVNSLVLWCSWWLRVALIQLVLKILLLMLLLNLKCSWTYRQRAHCSLVRQILYHLSSFLISSISTTIFTRLRMAIVVRLRCRGEYSSQVVLSPLSTYLLNSMVVRTRVDSLIALHIIVTLS